MENGKCELKLILETRNSKLELILKTKNPATHSSNRGLA